MLNGIEIDSYRRSEKIYEFLKEIFGNYLQVEEEKVGYIKLSFKKEELLKNSSLLLKKFKTKAWKIEPEFLRNIKVITQVFGLSETEKKVLTFAIVVNAVPVFKDTLSIFGELNINEFIEKLSVIIEVEKKELAKVLSYNSILFKTGLLFLNNYEIYYLGERIDVIEGLVDEMFLFYENPEEIFNNYLTRVKPTRFNKKDFLHVKEAETIVSYLKNVIKCRAKGVNILLYGPPGTGKTEFAKVIAKEAGGEAYEVTITNKKGEPLEEKERISCYRLAQFLLKRKRKSILIFDETDDILDVSARILFSLSDKDEKRGDALNKAWINRLLEENEVPTIWIANSISKVDPAYLRRFDVVLKMDYLPRSARLKILKSYFKNVKVSENWLKKMAEIKYLSPAIIEKAAKVVSISKSLEPEKEAEFIITSFLEALGFKESLKEKNLEKLPFIEEVLNTDCNIQKILSALKRSQRGKLLFYGPPGTGKTEFANQIAFHLDKELLLKRASDLISPYVGETEINIARMFKEARRENAVLFLDEADTFLLNRKEAKYSWEVSMVNELLTQIESFDGIFICATNLVEALDEAVMRRFDLKVKFYYLKEEQVIKFFAILFGEKEAEKYRYELSKLLLTPGNFATVYRRLKLLEDFSPENFVKALKDEARFNISFEKRKFGFV